MRALKIVGIVVLVLWMAHTTWRLEETRDTVQIVCSLELTAAHVTDQVRDYERICGQIYEFPKPKISN